MPKYICNFVNKVLHVKQEVCSGLAKACYGADVLYVTCIQKEWFGTEEEYKKLIQKIEGKFVALYLLATS